MFHRKNQTILSSHYSKLVDREGPSASGSNVGDKDDDEDFFSLKRADHDLPTGLFEFSDLSKRKIRMMKSKKALAKAGPKGTKLVFDDHGQAHAIYEFKGVEDIDVERDGAEFMKKEIGKMQRADVDDRAVAKEKKREKKRKRKEREREEVSPAINSPGLPSSITSTPVRWRWRIFWSHSRRSPGRRRLRFPGIRSPVGVRRPSNAFVCPTQEETSRKAFHYVGGGGGTCA